jgi:hypothetical protein
MAAALVLAALAGCLETEVALAPAEQATVDVKLVGEWKGAGDGSDGGELLVRNFNGREYYVEDRADEKARARYAVHVTDVKGASFLHARPLDDDGELRVKYAIMRLDRAGDDAFRLRHLQSDFFTDKPHDTPAKLRAIIEANLDNAAMYEGEPMPFTRVKRE